MLKALCGCYFLGSFTGLCNSLSLPRAEAYRALELLEQYLRELEARQGTEELQDALKKAIVAIRSRLFQALLGIPLWIYCELCA